MHMADALLSPAVGATMWVAAGSVLALSARRLDRQSDDRMVPLMGVLGAFIFAAQMINFAIPATGSSGHLGGGLLLAILLGPPAAFIVIASVLTVQALFFADGGLLALGANIFNLGFFPCFLAYPLIYRPLAGDGTSRARVVAASLLAAIIALQLGALGVVLQTIASGISNLSFGTFAALMLPIHLAIGIVEGIVTAVVVLFVLRARPDLFAARTAPTAPLGRLLITFAAAAALIGGVLSWFASGHPDGLEWSLERATTGEAAEEQGVKAWLAQAQQRVAILPDYDFAAPAAAADSEPGTEAAASWPDVKLGTSASGIVGGVLTLVLVFVAGTLLRRTRRSASPPAG